MGYRKRKVQRGVPAVVGMLFLFFFSGQNPVLGQAKQVVVPEEHSAGKALLLSIAPGAGQIYNGQAWKVPIIYGAFAGMGYLIHYNYQKMSFFKDEYLYRVNHDGAAQDANYANYTTPNIYNLYNSYDRNYQLMIIIAVGIYALNLVDAYVYGHLYDFHIDDDISLNLTPSLQSTPGGWVPSMGLQFRF